MQSFLKHRRLQREEKDDGNQNRYQRKPAGAGADRNGGGRLRACLPDARIETVIIKTKGDRILDKPLGEIGDKGLFVSELEAALLEKKWI